MIIGCLAFLGSCCIAQAQSWTGKASLLWRSRPHGLRASLAAVWNPRPGGNHRTAVLVVNDRGPFIQGRIIDVSTGAADILGFRHAGLAQVMVETVPN
jgi:rare lipoprotein A